MSALKTSCVSIFSEGNRYQEASGRFIPGCCAFNMPCAYQWMTMPATLDGVRGPRELGYGNKAVA